jgi:hypothetical protein
MRIFLAACAALAALGLQDRHDPNPPPLPGWLPDVPSGFAEAKRTGKPLMIVFR